MDMPHQSILTRPGTIVLPANLPFVQNLNAAGGRVVRQAGGHLVFYDSNNRRFLATDPEGNPFHVCAWVAAAKGTVRLVRARVPLDLGDRGGVEAEGLGQHNT